MTRKLYSVTGLVVLAIVFLAFIVFANNLFKGARIDFTENNIYTLSEGSKNILNKIEEPINLHFFYSDKATQNVPALRNYATRVKELLEEYQLHADGKIRLTVVDPEPFSEAEDQAAEFGLQSVPFEGGELYFGLVGTNALDSIEIISFFQPDKEEFLEYDISKLIYKLVNPKKPVVGLLSSIDMMGGFDAGLRRPTTAWIVMEQIEQLFEVRTLKPPVKAIDQDISLLMIVHPKALPDDTVRAIDQYVLAGGKTLIFVDPYSEIDKPDPSMQDPSMMNEPTTSSQSDLPTLFQAWGLKLREAVVVGDAENGMLVSTGRGMQPVHHIGLLALDQKNLSKEDIITAALDTVTLSSVGILEPIAGAATTFTPLITSSDYSMPLPVYRLQAMVNPEDLRNGFSPTGEVYTLAARVQGPIKTAFPDPAAAKSATTINTETAADNAVSQPEVAKTTEGERLSEAANINVIVVADTDMLSDRMWVRVQNFFGQTLAAPWANNADFAINALDNLSGDADLINIRSRGRFSRPFERVDTLKRIAESSFREKEQELQQQLQGTEQKLMELQRHKDEQNVLMLSAQQEQELQRFQEEKIKIRKQLREVRHQLDKDIEQLGTWLKFINIVLLPIVLTLLMALAIWLIRRKQQAR